jgi:two-component system, chemotaxis family, chemotaxis protein CheY
MTLTHPLDLGRRKGPPRVQSILIVDDDTQIRTLCRVVLEDAGYRVRMASQGAEALRLLDEAPADLVICDIFMPDKDGLETIPELRRRWPETRVLAISGGAGNLPDFLPTARRFGAVRTLQKPFTRDALLETVAAALGEAS